MLKRVIFFVQGEGRGHMTQAIAMKQLLEQNNYQVVACMVGTSKRRKVPDFFYDAFKSTVYTFESPNFVMDKKSKSIKILDSVFQNILKVSKYIKYIKTFERKFKEYKPDLVINFYDPLIGLYYFFKKPEVPLVCIGHQFMFLHHEFRFPVLSKWTDKMAMKLFTKLTSIHASKRIALSFYQVPSSPKNNVSVVPPLLRSAVFKYTPVKKDYILVYLVNHGYSEDIINWHKSNPHVKLHCFWDKPQNEEVYEFDDTLSFHKINDRKFLRFMSECKAVISTAGFESVCEAMYMEKPVLMVPVQGHFEQYCNARDAYKAGAGLYADTFNINEFMDYLQFHTTDYTSYKKWLHSTQTMMLNEINLVANAYNPPIIITREKINRSTGKIMIQSFR